MQKTPVTLQIFQPLPKDSIISVKNSEECDCSTEVCCGGPPPPKSSPFERAGYTLEPYVHSFMQVGSDTIPLIATQLSAKDHWQTALVRTGINRENYKIAPGLYGVGKPTTDSPVIVTANYKLTFDSVREQLQDTDCWLLVLDTCGVNVWCAAGKGTFSTEELVRRLELTGLADKVKHRKIIVPQLGATGVSAHKVKEQTGFRVVYGPVRAADISRFLAMKLKADESMRTVSFTLRERFTLIPVEIYLSSKKVLWLIPLLFLLSGIGPSIYSFANAWPRGLLANGALLVAIFSGCVFTPLLLPWLPGRSFSLKGLISGIICAVILLSLTTVLSGYEISSIFLSICAISSYLAMNFTGSTPYTSPSGVEKEMKIGIPLQVVALITGILLWLAAPFIS